MFARQAPGPTDPPTADPGKTVIDERGGRFVSSPEGDRTGVGPDRYDQTEPLPAAQSVGEPVTDSGTGPSTEPIAESIAESIADTRRWAHVSATATLSLVVGTFAIAATLTGLLAPLGFAGGVLAVLIGIAALYAVRRTAVTGHALVGLGVLFGLIAIVLSVLAMNDTMSWLSSKTDEVATVHTWLNDHMHWLRRW